MTIMMAVTGTSPMKHRAVHIGVRLLAILEELKRLAATVVVAIAIFQSLTAAMNVIIRRIDALHNWRC